MEHEKASGYRLKGVRVNDAGAGAEVYCPHCGIRMEAMFFMVGGGVWGSLSEEVMQAYGTTPDTAEARARLGELQRQSPIRCLIGNKGYHGDRERWPKSGWFCTDRKCLTITIKPTPQ